MIPKIIHYSWIGTEMPASVKKRVEEWKKTLPDWKFMFWNEDNYDFSKFHFTKSKIDEKDWGYATDELRYDVINTYGGFYFDTDMIVKKNLEPLLNKRMIWGFMYDNSLLTSFIGSEPNQAFLNKILSEYADENNYNSLMKMTSNPFVTNIFLSQFENFKLDGSRQCLCYHGEKINVFPRDYFCFPSHNRNANYMVHLFDNSWGTSNRGIYGVAKKITRRLAPVLYGEVANRRGVKYSQRFISK